MCGGSSPQPSCRRVRSWSGCAVPIRDRYPFQPALLFIPPPSTPHAHTTPPLHVLHTARRCTMTSTPTPPWLTGLLLPRMRVLTWSVVTMHTCIHACAGPARDITAVNSVSLLGCPSAAGRDRLSRPCSLETCIVVNNKDRPPWDATTSTTSPTMWPTASDPHPQPLGGHLRLPI